MKINLLPNKHLFVIFLLINAAGYDYESNPQGMHVLRLAFTKKIKQSNLPQIQQVIKLISQMPLAKQDLIRLANLAILKDKKYYLMQDPAKAEQILKQWKKIKPLLNKIVKSNVATELFKEYCRKIKKVKGFKRKTISKELTGVLNFFNLKNTLFASINIHLNLLDGYNRGTNYFLGNAPIISCSLNYQTNDLNWPTIRHEFMHLILKKILKNNLKAINKIIPVNKVLKQDNIRAKFDENFILAANLFFINDRVKRQNNLKFLKDKGFKKIDLFYNLIEKYFISQKKTLSTAILLKISKLETPKGLLRS